MGDTGPQAAGVIQTDFEHGAKDEDKMRAEGKDYVVKDGDVMNFLLSA